MPKYFTKFTTDEHNELMKYLISNGLSLQVLLVATCRASRKKNQIMDLEENEFYLSETEFKKFGLKKTQKGKLARTIKSLVDLKIFQKIGSKTGSKNAIVYSLNKGAYDCFDYQVGSEIGNRQGTDREQTGNRQGQNKNDKNEKSEKNTLPDNEILYNFYVGKINPKRKGKQRALKNINTHFEKHDPKSLSLAVVNYHSVCKDDEPQFRKDPANFFGINEKPFLDYLPGEFVPAKADVVKPPKVLTLEEIKKL